VVGLGLATTALSVFHPALLIFIPMALLLLALPPRRVPLIAVAVAVLVFAFVRPAQDAFWYVERGWALVLGAWFLVAVVTLRRWGFFARAFTAVAATAVTAALLFVTDVQRWLRLDWTVARRLRNGAGDVASLMGAGGKRDWGEQLAGALYAATELQATLYPALLALASLAALAIAWWAYRRLAVQERRPFAPLREFRFRDELVWLLIAGILLVLLPLGEGALRAGSNVLTFMGALYALRGVAVFLALAGAPGPAGVLLAALAVLFLYPLVMAAAVVVGLTDTWLDLRARRRAATGSWE